MSRLQKSELNRLSSTQQKRSGEWLKSKPTGDASGLTYPDEWASDILIGRSGEFSIIFTSSLFDTFATRHCPAHARCGCVWIKRGGSCLKGEWSLFRWVTCRLCVTAGRHLQEAVHTDNRGGKTSISWSINITYNHTQLPTSGVTCVKFKLFFFMLLWFCWEKMEIYIVEEKKKGIRIKYKVKTMR